jgi:ABC-2 type transport system ATP-binding protein
MTAALRRSRALELMERFGLTFALKKQLGDYSKGMKQKLALVRAMLHDPPVLLLDEPTSAMDPQSAKLVRDAIVDLQRDKRTFLITTHNLAEAQQLADTIAIIRHGRIIANDRFENLAQQFVGEPVMELHVRDAVEPLMAEISDLVRVEEQGMHWLRYRVADPDRTNPLVVNRLVAAGAAIISLKPISKTLEEIYLQVMSEDQTEQGGIVEHLR